MRVINLLKKGLRSKNPVGAAKPEEAEAPKKKGYSYNEIITSQINKYYRLYTSSEEQQISGRLLKDLYIEALFVTSSALDQIRLGQNKTIEKERITPLIVKIVERFLKNPYSNLLLYTYALTETDYLPAHIVNDIILTIGFAKSLGLSKEDLEQIGLYAFLHDAGMIYHYNAYNHFEDFTSKKLEDIRNHPFQSKEIANDLIDAHGQDVILDIHEREGGQGYPKGKKGSEITPWSKIISICDIYEALTHPRVFREEHTPFHAMKVLIKMKGTVIDERVVKKFIEFISIYPIGSLVYLNTGEIGIVIASNPEKPAKPIVRIVLTADGKLTERVIDLSKDDLLFVKRILGRDKEEELLSLFKVMK